MFKLTARGVLWSLSLCPASATSRDQTVTDSPVTVSRRRAASVVLGLLVALVTVLGMVCHDTHGQAVQPLAAVSSAQDPRDALNARASLNALDAEARQHLCAAPDHDQCQGRTAADTPTTGPGSHPLPQTTPARVDIPPAAVPAPVAARPAARPPNLHMLQVLRT